MTTTTLPIFTCHKTVRAARIDRIVDAVQGLGAMLKLAGVERPRRVSAEYIAKHDPVVGGYLVVYEDGYESYSPAAAFEAGYSPANPAEGMSPTEVFKTVVKPKIDAAQALSFALGMPCVSIVAVSLDQEVVMGRLPDSAPLTPLIESAVMLAQVMHVDRDSAHAMREVISTHPAIATGGGSGLDAPTLKSMH